MTALRTERPSATGKAGGAGVPFRLVPPLVLGSARRACLEGGSSPWIEADDPLAHGFALPRTYGDLREAGAAARQRNRAAE